MSRLDNYMFMLSREFTLWYGTRYGGRFPMHFVVGFPRSGTTWFCEMLSDYLRLPFPQHYLFPIGFASVVHTHAEPDSNLKEGFFVVRDGRDSMVSLYYYVTRRLKAGNYVAAGRFRSVFGEQPEYENIQKYLPAFMENSFKHPMGTDSHWGQHSLGWVEKVHRSNSKLVMARYEDLLQDPLTAFSQVLQQRFGEVNLDQARETVLRFQMPQQIQKSAEQHKTFLRKGVAGDWQNHFTPEARQMFDHYAGQALVDLGYEPNHDWVSGEREVVSA